MENTPRLYDTLVQVLSQHRKWLDVRHLKTLAWMMIGLIESGLISLTQWVPFVHGRAVFAQSSVRRFTRWLANERIDVHKLYGPLIQQALGSWGRHTLYLALDTSMLWEQYCVMRISVIYRGRAIPLVWQVIEHASSSVAYETYRALLDTGGHLAAAQLRGRVSGRSGFCRYGAHGPRDAAGLALAHSHQELLLSSIAAASGGSNSATTHSNRDRRTSGSMCRSPMSAMARCIWPWRTWPKMVNAGWWSAMNPPA